MKPIREKFEILMKLHEAIILTIPFKILNLVIAGVPAYFLWNWVIPDIFSLPEISLFQTLGLTILSQCFISSGFISLNSDL
jgi:hypothetical protein